MKAIKFASVFALTAVAAAVSHSSFALDLVKSDELTVNMNGDVDLLIKHDSNSSQRTEIESNFDDLDFDFKWKIDDSLTFIAASDWTTESQKGSTVTNAQSFVGAEFGNFVVRAGYQEDAIDPLGIDSFEIASLGKASGDQDGSGTAFAESLVFGYDNKAFKVLASFNEAESSNSDDGEIPSRLAFYGKTKVDNFQYEVGIGQEENFAETTSVDFWQAQVEYFTGPITLGALYSSMSVDETDSSAVDSTGLEFNVQYKVSDKLNLSVGYETIDNGMSGTDNYVGTGIGASYAFSKLVKLYVEAGMEDGTYITGKSTGPSTATRDDTSVVGMLLSVDF